MPMFFLSLSLRINFRRLESVSGGQVSGESLTGNSGEDVALVSFLVTIFSVITAQVGGKCDRVPPRKLRHYGQ